MHLFQKSISGKKPSLGHRKISTKIGPQKFLGRAACNLQKRPFSSTPLLTFLHTHPGPLKPSQCESKRSSFRSVISPNLLLSPKITSRTLIIPGPNRAFSPLSFKINNHSPSSTLQNFSLWGPRKDVIRINTTRSLSTSSLIQHSRKQQGLTLSRMTKFILNEKYNFTNDQTRSAANTKTVLKSLNVKNATRISLALLLFIFALVLFAIKDRKSNVPISGRRQYVFLSTESEMQMADRLVKQLLADQTVLPQDHPHTLSVKKVSQKLIVNFEDLIKNYKWEFYVVHSPVPNAVCVPGKVVVYTGLLHHCRDEESLATVLAHEIGHVVARHSAEQLNYQMPLQILLFIATFGLHLPNAGLLTLPILSFSRSNEYEADQIGLFAMAQSGYDPRKAIQFWTTGFGGSTPGGWWSTHPSGTDRKQRLETFLPEAMQIYEESSKNLKQFVPFSRRLRVPDV